MSDYFSQLGLKAVSHSPTAVRAQYLHLRAGLLSQLDRTPDNDALRRRLDDLHVAYRVLADAESQERCLAASAERPAEQMRRLIRASLEGGLLRHSRRARIIALGRALGFSDFHSQLLIAQVQFGQPLDAPRGGHGSSGEVRQRRGAAQLGAAGMLALAILLAMLRWSNLG